MPSGRWVDASKCAAHFGPRRHNSPHGSSRIRLGSGVPKVTFFKPKLLRIQTLKTHGPKVCQASAAMFDEFCLPTLEVVLRLADLLRPGRRLLDPLRAPQPVELPLELHDGGRGV